MSRLWDTAITLATIVMTAAAIGALVYAHLSITESRAVERRANANELWREILRLAFENPILSDPSLGLPKFDCEAKTVDGGLEPFQKYEMFVDTMLNASEEILEVSPTKERKAPARIQLLPQRAYLQSAHSMNSGYLDQYTAKFCAFVDEALNAHA
jgi:hypothetical protein